MIYIENTPIIKELRKLFKFIKLSSTQIIYFKYLDFIRYQKRNSKKNKYKLGKYIHFSNSNTEFRSWNTFSNLISFGAISIGFFLP